MPVSVQFTCLARKDLRSIHAYICTNDSQESADHVAREILRSALTLREFPQRGAHPQELLLLGNRSYRQIFFKPYRILYRIRGNTVFVGVVADGRRNLQKLLIRRLTGE